MGCSNFKVVIPKGGRILLRKILYLRASPRKDKREALAFTRLLLRTTPRVLLPSGHHSKINKKYPTGIFSLSCGDPEGSRTLDFLDENQTSWTTRRRDH